MAKSVGLRPSRCNDGTTEQPQGDEFSWQKYCTQYAQLHKAALKGDWETAERLLNEDCNLVGTRITKRGETALHIAAIEGHFSFVQNLLRRMNENEETITNNGGFSALFFAATTGHQSIAELMVRKNPGLRSIPACNGTRPVHMAALQGHKDMTQYLFSPVDFQSWNLEDQIQLLTTCIDSELYDLAMSIVELKEILVVTPNRKGEMPLEVLARKPSAFCHSNQKGLWDIIVNTMLAVMKLKKGQEGVAQCDAYKLFECLWSKIINQQDVETGQLNENASKLLFIAAESGNDEFVVELINQCPDFLYEMNNLEHSIFHIAISSRCVQLFNLIYELRGVKELITTYTDKDDNNILHLAAKIAPQNQLNCIPGPALQMQREVLWYKEIEKTVHPTYRKMKNSKGKTPYDLFLCEHKNLMKEGERVFRQTAKSCMLVMTLIGTAVFATTLTPIIEKDKLPIIFSISEAVAILFSLTSVLMFLSILVSGYTEMDFLNSLPRWLVIGELALFVAITSMMVTLGSCFSLYKLPLLYVIILSVLFACIPIMLLVLKYPLLVTVLRSSFGGRWLFQSNNRLF